MDPAEKPEKINTYVLLAAALAACLSCTPDMQRHNSAHSAVVAGSIAESLAVTQGERVLIGYDPEHHPEFTSSVKSALAAEGAQVELHEYGAEDAFAARLEQFDVYVWMPFSPATADNVARDEFPAASEWVKSAERRQIHFHWDDGTRALDGLRGEHTEYYSALYIDALDIDYETLTMRQLRAERILRQGVVRVRTPLGTDISFTIGKRPVTLQNGDASLDGIREAVLSIQREVELPAGALRVAPLEGSISGVIAIPYARLKLGAGSKGDKQKVARDLILHFEAGKLTNIEAKEGEQYFEAYIDQNPSLSHFREFAVGFNPKLKACPDEMSIPYYGYGAGVVRLSLGDNTELGGDVTGGAVRWFLFPDATVQVGSVTLVKNGVLADF